MKQTFLFILTALVLTSCETNNSDPSGTYIGLTTVSDGSDSYSGIDTVTVFAVGADQYAFTITNNVQVIGEDINGFTKNLVDFSDIYLDKNGSFFNSGPYMGDTSVEVTQDYSVNRDEINFLISVTGYEDTFNFNGVK